MNNNNEKKRKKRKKAKKHRRKQSMLMLRRGKFSRKRRKNEQPTDEYNAFSQTFSSRSIPFLHSRLHYKVFLFSNSFCICFFHDISFIWLYSRSQWFFALSLSPSLLLFCSPHLTHRLHITYICNHICGMRKVYSIKKKWSISSCVTTEASTNFFSRISIAFVPSLSNRTYSVRFRFPFVINFLLVSLDFNFICKKSTAFSLDWIFWLGRMKKKRNGMAWNWIRWPPNVPSNSQWTHYSIAKTFCPFEKLHTFCCLCRRQKLRSSFFHTHSFRMPFPNSDFTKKYLLSSATLLLYVAAAVLLFLLLHTVSPCRFWIYSANHETTKVLL